MITKFLSTLVGLVFWLNAAQAKCSGCGVKVFPDSGTISSAPILMIQGYASYQDVLALVGKSFEFSLQSKTERIPLKVFDERKGAYFISQLLVRPVKNLAIGEEYMLVLDTIAKFNPDPYNLGFDRLTWCELEPISWVVRGGKGEQSHFLSEPEFISNYYKELGCGPEIHADFNLDVVADSSFLIHVELEEFRHDTIVTSYFIPAKNDEQIAVGRRMCSGAFNFKRKHKYRARFQILDFRGKYSEPTSWISFENPLKSKPK